MKLDYDNEKGLLRLTIEPEEVRRIYCDICDGKIDPHTAQYSSVCMSCLKSLRNVVEEMRYESFQIK